ncbi:fumarylacetoacetate hydrolase family protein [Pollutimonas harenae]|uniref:Fumarylacetoacetate hydrolase family protein n=1 Tax=Pollutimonas harenae TaxID=657015 RepID=A0A853H3N4_9BURK|nr:fumarylacetoacetate hydrolase family protein [Pollutimonas harenae]NYT85173.1 fumarylacetoacetate hydrolase family protein [Pollutimonas harenae]TEA72449.1 FAA hydrolase family protein [Pollutimonas harenae]
MRIATYIKDQQHHVGLVSEDGLTVQALDIDPALAKLGVLGLIEAYGDSSGLAELGRGSPTPLDAVKLLAPIPHPRRNIFCVGRNYHAHAKELSGSVFKGNSNDPAAWPIVFTKVPETVIAHGNDVMLPTGITEQVDYEAELAIVIGKGGKNISQADAMSHVWGYTIVNDVTARDVQMRHQQWDLGKSFDTFCPMGPSLVTADAFDAANTRVRCWVNDELRQDGQTQDLIFDLPTLIETCSRGITLYPGDIIATGTPAGVGMGFTPPRYLKSGDRVRIQIDGIGTLENVFR